MQQIIRIPKRAVNAALSTVGLRLERVGTPREPAGRGPSQPAAEHFPTGVVSLGWRWPDDVTLADHTALAELRALYADTGSWPASISPEGGALLYWLIRNIQPATIVETGTCLGASTIWMAAALRAGIAAAQARREHDPAKPAPALHTFDDFGFPADQRLAASPLFHDRERKVRERIDRAGVGDLVRFHVGDSKVNIPKAHAELAARGGVQFAFIDGDHSAHGAIGDLKAIEPVLNVGGYVLLHDVFPEVCDVDGPRELLDRLEELSPGRYRWCEIYTSPLNYGLGLLRRVRR